MRLGPFVLAAVMLWPAAAGAQPRVPDTGMMALGAEAGAFVPSEDVLDSSVALGGFFEYYLSPRVSFRVGLGWTNPDVDPGNQSLRYIRVPFDLVYNWEGGGVHPYVGAGIAAYRLQFRPAGPRGGSEGELGASIFGGFEFFNSRTVSITGEARYELVPQFRGLNPDGLSVTIGIKKYF